jgi:O-Antigen ligase
MTAVMLAAVVLSLSVWGWRRSTGAVGRNLAVAAVGIAVLTTSTVSGWDTARGVGQISLVVAVMALIWLASRSRCPEGFPELLALLLAGLALWGFWQIATGLEEIRLGLEELPETARIYAAERLASRRAFASLPLPSHLAVLLATALPLLLARVRVTAAGFVWATGAAVAVVGLAATRSPVGVGLALLACAALTARRSRVVVVVTLLLAAALVGVVAVRSDVARFEPVSLRADNWRTAIWLWQTAPTAGVGVASFAQATQNAPLQVGNRPAHAHNLPLECLAELGPAGLILCGLAAVGLLQLVWGLWPREPALASAVMVVPLHNLVDFSLFVSGVAVPWAVLVGWALATRKRERETTEAPGGRVFVVLAASVGLALVAMHATGIVVEQASAPNPDPVERFSGAVRSLELAPWRIEPQFLLASAALDSRDPALLDRAWVELESKRWLRPGSAALAERRARVALARGSVSLAVAELWAAVELGGPDKDRDRFLGELLRELEGDVGAATN